VGGARCEGSSAARGLKLSGLTLLCTSMLSMPAMLCACWGAATCVGRVLYAGSLGCLCCVLLVWVPGVGRSYQECRACRGRGAEAVNSRATNGGERRLTGAHAKTETEWQCRGESGAGGIAESNVTAGCGIRGCCSARRVVVRVEGLEAEQEHVEAGKESAQSGIVDNIRDRGHDSIKPGPETCR
jgi:hypothetical protein